VVCLATFLTTYRLNTRLFPTPPFVYCSGSDCTTALLVTFARVCRFAFGLRFTRLILPFGFTFYAPFHWRLSVCPRLLYYPPTPHAYVSFVCCLVAWHLFRWHLRCCSRPVHIHLAHTDPLRLRCYSSTLGWFTHLDARFDFHTHHPPHLRLRYRWLPF